MIMHRHSSGEWMTAAGTQIFSAAAMMIITAAAYVFWRGAIDWSLLLILFPVGLVTAGIFHSHHIVTGIKNESRGSVSKASAVSYGFEMLFPFVWIGVLSIFGILPLTTIIVFLTLVAGIGCAQTMMKAFDGGLNITSDLDARTATLQLVFSVFLTISLVADKLV